MYLCFISFYFVFFFVCLSVGNSVGVKKFPALSVPHPSEVRNLQDCLLCTVDEINNKFI